MDLQILGRGFEDEIDRLRNVVSAQRRLLIQWTEAYSILKEESKFICR